MPVRPGIGGREPFRQRIDTAKEPMQRASAGFFLKEFQPLRKGTPHRRRRDNHKERNIPDRKQSQMGITGEQDQRDKTPLLDAPSISPVTEIFWVG